MFFRYFLYLVKWLEVDIFHICVFFQFSNGICGFITKTFIFLVTFFQFVFLLYVTFFSYIDFFSIIFFFLFFLTLLIFRFTVFCFFTPRMSFIFLFSLFSHAILLVLLCCDYYYFVLDEIWFSFLILFNSFAKVITLIVKVVTLLFFCWHFFLSEIRESAMFLILSRRPNWSAFNVEHNGPSSFFLNLYSKH